MNDNNTQYYSHEIYNQQKELDASIENELKHLYFTVFQQWAFSSLST